MPSGSGSWRWQANRAVYDEFARSTEVRDLLKERADAGGWAAIAIAPDYSGPTWDPAVQRHGEYKRSIYSAVSLQPNGWRAEFGAQAPWTLQIEFGTGRTEGRRRDSQGRFRSARQRPQRGSSPKFRVLGRALDALRAGST